MTIETLACGYGLIEGPRVDGDGNLYFSDVTNGGVFRPEVILDAIHDGRSELAQPGARPGRHVLDELGPRAKGLDHGLRGLDRALHHRARDVDDRVDALLELKCVLRGARWPVL